MTTTDDATEIHGTCDPRFEPVRERFAANFAEGTEVGASVAVTLGGEPVVDLWAGDAVPGERPWARDTIVNCWSVTKTMAAITTLLLADRG
ncbi:MAG: serine hydrolase, partial [Acidimicrobiales bacterium]|nr:serine hydrolase [Acidimicrobiales bacterium]